MPPVAIAAGVGAVGGIASSAMGAYGQEKATDEATKRQMQMNSANIASTEKMFGQNLDFQKAQEAADRAAYESALKTGSSQMGEGEGSLLSAIGTENPELATMEKDIASKTAKQLQQGQSQMGANLAAQGVRGGAAATLMNRGTGEMATAAQESINAMKYGDSATRAADLRAYMAQKARLGQGATLAGMAK
jgi:hypothetical protein